ncbi:MAG: hypothetical protein WC599_00765 [Bacteroidales bacterium]
MARKIQSQNIDRLIHSIETIIENRCSLSDEDLIILNEVNARLLYLKRKKGKTNSEILKTVVKIVELLSNFFGENEDKNMML